MPGRARVTIIDNRRCIVSGLDKHATRLLDDALSIEIQGAQFQRAVRNGMWDGRRHLFSKKTNIFPRGLLPRVLSFLEDLNWHIKLVDDRVKILKPPDLSLVTDTMLQGDVNRGEPKRITLRPYQLKAIRKALRKERGILWIATNGGKCLAPNTRVLRANGTRVRAIDVTVGDLLMSPTGPKRVLSTTTGRDQMYRVSAVSGSNSFVCNSVHVLTIADSDGIISDVPLDQYLTWSDEKKRRSYMVLSPADFPEPTSELLVDPWLLGLWYADGRKDLSFVEITKPDDEIRDALETHATNLGLILKCSLTAERCPQWRLVSADRKNSLLIALREVYGDGTRLPKRYLRGTIAERRAFLAGIIDGDGHGSLGGIDLVWKHKRWVDDLAFLARSLGFRVSISKKRVRLPKWLHARTYWRAYITGDTSDLPLTLERKHVKAKKRWMNPGFTVTPVGKGPYAGFTLGGDGRFMLGDFTVTHNTEIASALIKVLGAHRTLFLVHKQALLDQARERIARRLGTIEEHIGIIGAGQFDPKHITVATIQTLSRKMHPKKRKIIQGYFNTIGQLHIDEGHHSKATTWYKLINRIDAQYRFIYSGTPFGSGNGLMVEAVTGPVIHRVTNAKLIKLGVSAKPTIEIIPCDKPELASDLSWMEVYKLGIVENEDRNYLIAKRARKLIRAGQPTMILVSHLFHGDLIRQQLDALGVACLYAHGKMPRSVQKEIVHEFENSKTSKVLIASPIFDEGVDMPAIRGLIVADGGKSIRSALQKIGRGLRKKSGTNTLCVVDFADMQHKWLARHAQERIAIYENEGFVIK